MEITKHHFPPQYASHDDDTSVDTNSTWVDIPATNSTDDGTFELLKRANHCGAASFQNTWNADQPTVEDCLQMAANIGGDGDWTIHHIQAVREIAKHKSCQFRAHVEGFNKKTKIGNEDIRDLVFSSNSSSRTVGSAPLAK